MIKYSKVLNSEHCAVRKLMQPQCSQRTIKDNFTSWSELQINTTCKYNYNIMLIINLFIWTTTSHVKGLIAYKLYFTSVSAFIRLASGCANSACESVRPLFGYSSGLASLAFVVISICGGVYNIPG